MAAPTQPNDAAIAISDADIARYDEEGAVCLRGLFGPDLLDEMRDATERLLAGETQNMAQTGKAGRFAGDVHMWQKDEAFRSFVFDGPSRHIARTLMQSSTLRFFTDQLFVKEPGTESPTPWHQDLPYWPVLGDQICSVWVTMDPVTIETSGLQYIKGSHRWGKRFDPEDFGDFMSLEFLRDAANEKLPDIEANRDRYEFLSWDMEPGDCLVHHSMAVHGAGGNRSSTIRRRAISTRWLGDDVRFRPFAMFTTEMTGMEPGAPITSPIFPAVAC